VTEIYPKLTIAKLKKAARKTSEGRGLAPLPGVKTDAKEAAKADPGDPRSPYYGSTHHDAKGYAANRKLSARISEAVDDLKTTDEHGARFVLAWRMYPNNEHPSWHRTDVHQCGCGCGCFASAPPKAGKASRAGKATRASKTTRASKAPRRAAKK
jgi:hypothetical protein